MSVVDWNSKPEPWRSIGLDFLEILAGREPRRRPVRRIPRGVAARPDMMSKPVKGATPGERIRNMRLARGWTQDMLANRVGLVGMGICHIENGRHDRKHRAAIARTLGVEIGDIWYDGD